MDVTIRNVDFDGYEVAAVALNGVDGLDLRNVTATNRKDVPVLGTFSSAQFIKHYLDQLDRTGSATTLSVQGVPLTVGQVRDDLRVAINTTHADVMRGGRISPAHTTEYELFHNRNGVVDGNSYSFLVNSVGVAVNGFPSTPDEESAARDIRFTNVHVVDQVAAINEVPAIDVGGAAAIDPIGAVFQTQNRHPDTGAPITIAGDNSYVGNPVANAQAIVARAAIEGELDGSHLSTARLNLTNDILDWVEGAQTFSEAGISYLCNGDSMFHVDKGVFGFRIDGAREVQLTNTSVRGLTNRGSAGDTVCGDYGQTQSHPAATLAGYGGSALRAYSFAGTREARVRRAAAEQLRAQEGSVVGFDVLTDSTEILLSSLSVRDGVAGPIPAGSPTPQATAYAIHVGEDASHVTVRSACAEQLTGEAGDGLINDESGNADAREGRRC